MPLDMSLWPRDFFLSTHQSVFMIISDLISVACAVCSTAVLVPADTAVTDGDHERSSLTDDLHLSTPTLGGHQPAQPGPSVDLSHHLVSAAGVDQPGHQPLPTLSQAPQGEDTLQGEGLSWHSPLQLWSSEF